MVPTVTQHLLAMQDTMLRFVLPAISPDEAFAREQAGLIMASLGWLADVNESQHPMEAQDHDDLVSFFGAIGFDTRASSQIDETPSFASLASLGLPASLLDRLRPILRVWVMTPGR